jgi:hypothetical protein
MGHCSELAVWVAVIAAVGAGRASASVVQTFSFETPDVGVGNYYYNPAGSPGVTYNGISGPTGGGGSGIAANGSGFSFPDAPDGTQVAFIQDANGTYGQITLALSGLTADMDYDATFYTAERPDYPANPLVVDFDGSQVGSYADMSSGFTLQTTSSFEATGGADTLTFTGQALPALGGNVGLDLVTIQSVPEPISGSVVLVGLGLLGAARRPARASGGHRRDGVRPRVLG